ncbi:CASP-like protein 1 [Malania oleifera]|uniref:CASP-like protein 1 n=1 Tax=Malania oleifera TaxID=397392 RepID=UPI0025AE7DDE|nr:CASP-like protein 1 [Malania oleifera]
MATTDDKPAAAAAAAPEEYSKKEAVAAAAAPQAGSSIEQGKAPAGLRGVLLRADYLAADVGLRILIFATTLTAVVVMATSKQTKLVPVPVPPFLAPVAGKFQNSPAFIYYIAALSVAGLYSIISTLASLSTISKPAFSKKIFLYLALLDVLMLGLVASATGTAGGVGYIGYKGNSHANWLKVCNIYDKYCRYVAVSIFISLAASILLLLLVMLSIFSLHCRSRP